MTRFIAAILLVISFATGAKALTITELKTPGGIEIWLVQDATVPMIAMEFAFAKGAATDKPGKSGTAHFLTGLMDEGAGDLSGEAFQAKRDDLGIKISFEAGIEHFQGTLQTVTQHKAEAFALLRRALNEATFPDEAIERMRQSFIVNASSAENDPQTIASRALMKALLDGHVYSGRPRGTPDSLAAITRDDLVESYKNIFTRRGMKIAVVGDISPAELSAELDRTFGTLPQGSGAAEISHATISATGETIVIERNIPQSIVMLGMKGIGIKDPDFFAAFVMSQILGGDSDARLSNEIREKRGLTYGVGFELSPMEFADLYVGSFSTVNEKAGEAIATLKDTIRTMAKDGPTQAELDDIKKFLTGSFGLRFDSSSKIAGYLLGQQLLGRDSGYILRRNNLIEAVTLDQVKAQAQRLLKPDTLKVVIIGKPQGIN
jgi:zinc protease